MRHRLLVAVVCLISSPALAINTARELAAACAYSEAQAAGRQLDERGMRQAERCVDFIQGALAMYGLTVPDGARCIPRDATLGQSIRAIYRWVVENPIQHDTPAAIAITVGLHSAFPCGR